MFKIILGVLFIVSHTVFAQEYTHDVAGNSTRDNNKQITSIHYNHLNLVDTIAYSDGRKIIYTYTGTGQKLRENNPCKWHSKTKT
jgi:hypothetical protein